MAMNSENYLGCATIGAKAISHDMSV